MGYEHSEQATKANLDLIKAQGEEIERLKCSQAARGNVLKYVLFALTGSNEIESDLGDAVQCAADRVNQDLTLAQGLIGKYSLKVAALESEISGLRGELMPDPMEGVTNPAPIPEGSYVCALTDEEMGIPVPLEEPPQWFIDLFCRKCGAAKTAERPTDADGICAACRLQFEKFVADSIEPPDDAEGPQSPPPVIGFETEESRQLGVDILAQVEAEKVVADLTDSVLPKPGLDLNFPLKPEEQPPPPETTCRDCGVYEVGTWKLDAGLCPYCTPF